MEDQVPRVVWAAQIQRKKIDSEPQFGKKQEIMTKFKNQRAMK